MGCGGVYLFCGSEIGEKNTAIDTLKRNLLMQCPALDYHSFYALDTSIQEVLSLLSSGGLFSDATFIVYKDAQLIKKKEDILALIKYIGAAQNTKNVLVLTSDEYSIDKKIENAIPKQNCKRFWEMFENQKVPWLVSLFQKQGLRLQLDAAASILELVENDTQTLKNSSLVFFTSFPKGHIVTVQDVDDILQHNKEETPFTLFDAMAQPTMPLAKRFEKALCILQTLTLAKDASPVSLIAGLCYSFKMLRTYHILVAQGKTSDFDLKTKGFSSKKAQKRYQNATKVWNINQTNDCLSCLNMADFNIRKEGQACLDTKLKLLIYQLAIKKGLPLAN